MKSNKKFNNLEINDLIETAVNNAITRRHQPSEEGLQDLSEAEANNIAGGAVARPIVAGYIPPIVVGKIAYPPTTIGIVANEPVEYLA